MERVASGGRERAHAAHRRLLGAALAMSAALHAGLLLGLAQWAAREQGIGSPGPLRARLLAPAEPARVESARVESARVESTRGRRLPARMAREPRAAPLPDPPFDARALQAHAPAPPSLPEPGGVPPGPASPDSAPAREAAAPGAAAAAAGVQAGAPVAGAAAQAAAEEAATIGQYRIALIESARAFRSYPRLARENHWQGRVAVRVAIARGGMVAALGIAASSGYPVLDAQALEMIRRAQARTPVPAALHAHEFSIEIPVIFDLRDE